jgi:uncharacterized protein YndB with AHSA1/START domain
VSGTVRAGAGGRAVRFERRYGASPEELWAAWTDPERLSRWLGAVVAGTVAPGSAFRLEWGEDASAQVELVVRELRRPELLVWEWTVLGEPPTLLRVELTPDGGGTLLALDHSRLPAAQQAGHAAGWEAYLDALAADDASGWDQAYAAALPGYRERVAALG